MTKRIKIIVIEVIILYIFLVTGFIIQERFLSPEIVLPFINISGIIIAVPLVLLLHSVSFYYSKHKLWLYLTRIMMTFISIISIINVIKGIIQLAGV